MDYMILIHSDETYPVPAPGAPGLGSCLAHQPDSGPRITALARPDCFGDQASIGR